MSRRRLLGLALALAAVLLFICLKPARAKPPRLDRVGGKANACACTQRIEP